jgi:hypothetical protein
MAAGQGQYRLRLRRWRFRYDIYGQDVMLTYCGLRSEATYRHTEPSLPPSAPTAVPRRKCSATPSRSTALNVASQLEICRHFSGTIAWRPPRST